MDWLRKGARAVINSGPRAGEFITVTRMDGSNVRCVIHGEHDRVMIDPLTRQPAILRRGYLFSENATIKFFRKAVLSPVSPA